VTICPCDVHAFPDAPDIAPGLSRLPRELGRFGDFKKALTSRIGTKEPLRDWRVQQVDDLGLLTLEWWAYVADVLSFYTSQHANELYLATAARPQSLHRIVGLIGYQPRPATSAVAKLVALVDGSDAVAAPAATRFVSDAFGDSPPQEFETEAEATLDPRRNEWTLAPIRGIAFDAKRMLLVPASRAVAEDAVVLLVGAGSAAEAHRVVSIGPERALDGERYLRLELSGDVAVLEHAPDVAAVSLWSFAQAIPISSIRDATVIVDGLQPQIRTGGAVVVEDATGRVEAHTVKGVTHDSRQLPSGVEDENGKDIPLKAPTTLIELGSKPSKAESGAGFLHVGPLRAGRFVAPALHLVGLDALEAGARVEGPNDVPAEEGSGEVLLKGALDAGATLPGQVVIDGDTGATTLIPSDSAQPFESPLRTPIRIYGNVLTVTRGKSVEETLGSGRGAVDFQTFALGNKPLTYVTDATAPKGRRSTLRIFVDKVEWRETSSLFLAGPDDRVFSIALDSEGQATVTFGGGGYGLPAPLGVDNIVARYRYGAGEAPPPANSIRQIAGPVPGLRSVFNVRPAQGGGRGDGPEDIRFVAAASAATFDRAVSAADFVAHARDFGALAAIATTEWVPERTREGVVVTAIFEGDVTPESKAALEQYLAARAAEATPIRVIAATPFEAELELAYAVAADADPALVASAIQSQLVDDFRGLLAARNARIGGPIFRSSILAAAARVAGLDEIVSLQLDGATCPHRIPLGAQAYLAPTLSLVEVEA